MKEAGAMLPSYGQLPLNSTQLVVLKVLQTSLKSSKTLSLFIQYDLLTQDKPKDRCS